MARTAHYTALGLASLGLLGSSLLFSAAAHGGDHYRHDRYKEVDGSDCIDSGHDRECKSKTSLEVDEWRVHGHSGWKKVKLSADVDFFEKKSDHRRSRHDDHRNRDHNKCDDWNRNRDDCNRNRDHNKCDEWNRNRDDCNRNRDHNKCDNSNQKRDEWNRNRDDCNQTDRPHENKSTWTDRPHENKSTWTDRPSENKSTWTDRPSENKSTWTDRPSRREQQHVDAQVARAARGRETRRDANGAATETKTYGGPSETKTYRERGGDHRPGRRRPTAVRTRATAASTDGSGRPSEDQHAVRQEEPQRQDHAVQPERQREHLHPGGREPWQQHQALPQPPPRRPR